MDDFQAEFNDEFLDEASMPMDQVNQLCVEFKELRDQIKEISDAKSELEKKKKILEARILRQFELGNMKQHRSDFGLFYTITNTQVSQPNNKDMFISYIKEKGAYDELMHISPPALKRWVKEELEKRANAGNMDESFPGLDPVTKYKTIGLKK